MRPTKDLPVQGVVQDCRATPTVSIITVSYNSARTIRDTIRSVQSQTYPHVEYIVIDGGSTDETVDILQENDAVIDTWISEPDQGIYDAMNKGICKSRGEIIGILNSDDWYEPQAIETAIQVFESDDDVDLVHGAMNVWTKEGDVHARYGSKERMPPEFVAPFHHPTCFVRRRVYSELGLFAQDLPTAADYDFMLRFMRSGRKEMYVDRVLANFRRGGATSQYSFSPYGQLWRVLRRNKHGILASWIALSFRGLRDLVAYAIDRLSLRRVQEYTHRYIPYHTS